jgi:hypothetical protein
VPGKIGALESSLIASPPNAEAVDLLAECADKRLPFTLDQVRALLEVADREWRGLILLGLLRRDAARRRCQTDMGER